jgi:hypothetical protein|tara:strand:- start:117 stop:428 length:312 start_codon:yes stop_codon:yes gene_type:complete
MALPGYPGKRRPTIPGSRPKSGKLLRRALYQTVYAWTPFEPEFNVKTRPAVGPPPQEEPCCEYICSQVIDNCVTYVDGGQVLDEANCIITPPGGAYVECEYVD